MRYLLVNALSFNSKLVTRIYYSSPQACADNNKLQTKIYLLRGGGRMFVSYYAFLIFLSSTRPILRLQRARDYASTVKWKWPSLDKLNHHQCMSNCNQAFKINQADKLML
ncbi:hypothetical protein ABZP36_011542 [Zizania latifolia]